MKSRRHLVAVFIVGFWLMMTGLLVYRDVLSGSLRSEVVLTDATWIEEPVETWLVITTAGSSTTATEQRVGWARVRQEPMEREGVEGAQMEAEVHLQLNLLGRRTALDMEGRAWRARRQKRAELDFRVASGESEFELSGSILGDRLQAQIRSGGDVTPLDLRLPDNAFFSTGFGTALSFPALSPGEETVIQSFDPMTLRPTRARVRAVSSEALDIGGERIAAVRLRVQSSGLDTTAWIDEHGQVIRAETPLGLHLEKSTRAQALAPIGDDPNVGELLRITAVRPTGERPFRGARELLATLRGGEEEIVSLGAVSLGASSLVESDVLSGLQVPRDFRQQPVDGGRIQFSSGENGDHRAPSEVELSSYLAADPFIAADHPRIAAQAQQIVAEAGVRQESSPAARRAQAIALHDWAFDQIEKVPVLSLPSALEVLENRRGDCNEHTILYTALARSIGLPTRVAIGLVWSDVLGGFYYHAWPEVWLGDAWLATDPTLGQRVADATHIKLLEGGIERWPQLLPFLGNLAIEVHSIE